MGTLKRKCMTYLCPNLHKNRSGYCDECERRKGIGHYRTGQAPGPKPYDGERPSAVERGYDHQWHKFSERFLRAHPVCAMCGAPAEVTDHIIPADVWMDVYGRFDYDEANYQPLCRKCNAIKGRTQDKAYRAGYRAEKGEPKG